MLEEGGGGKVQISKRLPLLWRGFAWDYDGKRAGSGLGKYHRVHYKNLSTGIGKVVGECRFVQGGCGEKLSLTGMRELVLRQYENQGQKIYQQTWSLSSRNERTASIIIAPLMVYLALRRSTARNMAADNFQPRMAAWQLQLGLPQS